MKRFQYTVKELGLDKERGAVLLMTLLVMSIMATLAIALMDITRVSLKRTGNMAAYAQADWYVKGAEDFAAVYFEEQISQVSSTELGLALRAGEPIVLPLDGGMITLLVSDGSDCFSLGRLSDATGQSQFVELLNAIGWSVRDIDSLIDHATDYIDSDSQSLPYGGEDYVYLGRTDLPHRAANIDFQSTMGLRVLPGMNEEAYQAIRPFVCARSSDTPLSVNVNSLELWQAPLLTAMLGSAEHLEVAQNLIKERPDSGYASIADFQEAEPLKGVTLKALDLGALTVEPEHIWIEAQINYLEANRVLVLDYTLDNGELKRDYRRRTDEARRSEPSLSLDPNVKDTTP